MILDKESHPIYSICMCNYNMADTLELSLTSILDQLDERYEVVITDDGSVDDSINIIERLQKKYANLRLISLKRDKKRKLGFTRNISIKEARGKYVLLHLDCDDIYDSYIDDFVRVFHQIEQCVGYNILLSGQHINMGQRDYLLKHGPYRNLFRAEDRDLWIRMAAINAYMPLKHQSFVTRLPKKTTLRLRRIFIHTWDQIVYDFRTGMTVKYFLTHEKNKRQKMSLPLKILRTFYIVPARFYANFHKRLHYPENMNNFEKVQAYREQKQGSFTEILRRNNCKPDFSMLSKKGRELFEHNLYTAE